MNNLFLCKEVSNWPGSGLLPAGFLFQANEFFKCLALGMVESGEVFLDEKKLAMKKHGGTSGFMGFGFLQAGWAVFMPSFDFQDLLFELPDR